MNLIETILQVTESQSYAETTNDEIVLTKFLALSKNQQELIDDFFVTLLNYKFTDLLGLHNKEKFNHITQQICIKWHIEDVQSIRQDLTDEQAAHVLEVLAKNHDAELGINWDVIEIVADNEYPKSEND